jgi:hypothetical protein
MMTRFRPLLTVAATHAYVGGSYPGIEFVLAEATAAALPALGLLARVRDGVLHLLSEGDPDGHPRLDAEGRVLRIGIRPSEPWFEAYTRAVPAGSTALLQRSAAALGALESPVPVAVVAPAFSHGLAIATRPVKVSLLGGEGRDVLRAVTVEASDVASVRFALGFQESGWITVVEEGPSGATGSTEYYAEGALAGASVRSILELTLAAELWASPSEYQVAFDAREETLSYYVVATRFRDTEFNQLAISDKGANDEARPQVTFNKRLPPFSAAELSPALLGPAEAKIALFQSKVPIPRRRNGRRKIQLTRNGEVLVEHLPQPGADSPDSNIVVHVTQRGSTP